MKKRVVVTGMSAITALGDSWPDFFQKIQANTSAVRYMKDWGSISELNTRVAAPVPDFTLPAHYKRKQTRTMGRVAKLAVRSAEIRENLSRRARAQPGSLLHWSISSLGTP